MFICHNYIPEIKKFEGYHVFGPAAVSSFVSAARQKSGRTLLILAKIAKPKWPIAAIL